jgi:intracellular multiplication protein IcmX
MKLLSRCSLIAVFCFASYPAAADNIMNSSTDAQNTSNNTSQIATYLLNLGLYLGFDLASKNPPSPPEKFSSDLMDGTSLLVTHQLAFDAFLGAIPVSFIPGSLSKFLPSGISYANAVNGLANMTFKGYGDKSSQNAIVTANALVDAPAESPDKFLSDPVSQAVFNILGTPDFTYCMNNDGSQWKSDCNLLYQNKVMFNILGYIPHANDFFSYTYNNNIINQLNTNSLLAPLMYSTEQLPQNPPPKDKNGKNSNPGLTAQNQAQQANNFVRYASGLTVPTSLPSFKEYSDLYTLANQNIGKNPPDSQQMQAQATLATYFNNLRVYAAQSSVGISNLYYIMSKRIPQNLANEPTSQALIEFNMATHRLFVPDTNSGGNTTSKPNTQWTAELNTASSATIQKEIAVLLAEINYQMYLDRQLQERMLLTNTILLMQNLKSSQPSSDFGTQGTDASSATIPTE